MHKLFAGLIDAAQHAGSDRAKMVVVRLADWANDTTANLSDPQMQTMLRAEQGGMSESLANVYAMTGDEKYLKLAERFTHRAVIDPLADGKDQLDGLHANTQVPKLVAAARIYELTGGRLLPRRGERVLGRASSPTAPTPRAATATTNTSSPSPRRGRASRPRRPRRATSTTCCG